MTRFNKGDRVAAIQDIGGIVRDKVPAGTTGVVIEAAWGQRATVQFRVSGLFSGDRPVVVPVNDHEIS